MIYQTSATIKSQSSLMAGPRSPRVIQRSSVVSENPHQPRFLTIPRPKGSADRGTQATTCEHRNGSMSANSNSASNLPSSTFISKLIQLYHAILTRF